MTNSKIDLEYFERGLGLVLAQIEHLIERVGNVNYKYVEPLTFKEQALEAVQDDDEFQKQAAAFSDIRQDIIDDPLFKDDREIFLIVTEIDRLNNQLLNLLSDKKGSHSLEQVQKYLIEQFGVKIREILSFNERSNVLNTEALSILNILVNEKNFKDIQEGINLVVSLTPLDDNSKPVFETLAEAHILVIYYDMLKQKLPELKTAKPATKTKAKPKKKK